MKKKTFYKLVILLFTTLYSCNNDDNPKNDTNKSSEKLITNFTFEASKNSGIDNDIIGIVNQDNNTIQVTFPSGTDISNLTPTISISNFATILPNTKTTINLTTPVRYIVTAENETLTQYTLEATFAAPPILSDRDILELLYNSNPNNNLNWDLNATTMNNWSGVIIEDEKVTELDLSNSKINNIPIQVQGLSKLTKFNASLNSGIKSIPQAIINLGLQLKNLDLSFCSLTKLPTELNNFKNIENLNLKNNLITQLPNTISNLQSLTRLDISSNFLVQLPSTIGALKKIEFLILENNQINSLPDEIGNLNTLKGLYLNKNQLALLPSTIKNLSELSTLKLGYNNLSIVHSSIGLLPNLKTLELQNNQLIIIDCPICSLPKIEELLLQNNRIVVLPMEIGELKTLKTLNIINNPFTHMSQEICDLELTGTVIEKNLDVTCN
ncbi:Leucine rich repeat-containing protein [Zobellia uliginosa]|uniref:Leucine rich repeat-containing protein n=1 Tax=Zobellia uliginosa TaxID=143224 RepID=A0ABY1L2D1_9FLAO|nr:hypothetical protein [Zobellia uliginosa]SIT11882.1 Leucine rich repeat-containing protein [Zobellia uliginosa]